MAILVGQCLGSGGRDSDFLDFQNSKMVILKTLCTALALLLLIPRLVQAEQKLKAGVAGQAPFVNAENPPGGAAVDIWEKIAADNEWSYDYIRFDT